IEIPTFRGTVGFVALLVPIAIFSQNITPEILILIPTFHAIVHITRTVAIGVFARPIALGVPVFIPALRRRQRSTVRIAAVSIVVCVFLGTITSEVRIEIPASMHAVVIVALAVAVPILQGCTVHVLEIAGPATIAVPADERIGKPKLRVSRLEIP